MYRSSLCIPRPIPMLVVVLLLILVSACAEEDDRMLLAPQTATHSLEQRSAPSDLSALDANRDGEIDPYEALDVLLSLQAEQGGALSTAVIHDLTRARQEEELAYAREYLLELAPEGDGREVQLSSIRDDEARGFASEFDLDGDGVLRDREFVEVGFDVLLSSEEEIQARLDELMSENDANGDGRIDLTLPEPEAGLDNFREWDSNRDGWVTRDEIYAFMKADNTPATFQVEGTVAYMNGVITAELPAAVLRLIVEHPRLRTIEMLTVPGSVDDEANLRAAMYIHNAGIATRLNARSSIASGGTDFFLAGVERSVEPGATIGVHSWGGPGMDGADVPEDDPQHQPYIDYYIAIGIPAEFYWYTMRAAPASDIHIMTEEEIARYKVRSVPAS